MTGTIDIADGVWRAWRRVAGEEDEWRLQLVIRSPQDPGVVEVRLAAAIEAVTVAFERAHERPEDPDPLFAGEWSWLRTAKGVVLGVTECDAFDELLPAIAARLADDGVVGRIELHRPRRGESPPWRAPVLVCRMRVRGERSLPKPRVADWEADRALHLAVVGAADAWCVVEGAPRSMNINASPWVEVQPGEEVASRITGDRASVRQGRLAAVGVSAFRGVGVSFTGSVALVAGGGQVQDGAWRDTLTEMVAFLVANADRLVYANITRGWSASAALHPDKLNDDWPERLDSRPKGIGFSRVAFEDLYAPDAFGVQLLGPGYTGRIPQHPSWRAEPVGEGATLLSHVDPAAWFTEPFVPESLSVVLRADRPIPPVLADARNELADILYQRGVLAEYGMRDRAAT